MTQDEIIRMAREAGFDSDYFDNVECSCDECNFLKKPLERFAALVAAHEREACAKVCDIAMIPNPTTSMFDAGVNSALSMCAAAIRARGEK